MSTHSVFFGECRDRELVGLSHGITELDTAKVT